ncbi:MAG: AmmeMemoRadiSam system protein B [Ignavibacteria bacterium]|nr:AmmeMemoRadiSam system protein B [Ignavibacteria bacterium]
MKNKTVFLFLILILFTEIVIPQDSGKNKIRLMADTVGFASKSSQMDEFMKRIPGINDYLIKSGNWKICITPHDDYTYVGGLYPALLTGIKSKTVIFFGVTHKARLFNLENKIIFDSFKEWEMPYGNVKISGLREEITAKLPQDFYLIHDSIQSLEHSVEAIVPFLQYYNRNVEIISILIPYMTFDKINEISEVLAGVVFSAANKNGLQWGDDYAIIISSDAVHYGDEEWGGNNYAPFGADSTGYKKAVAYEYEIINNCLTGEILLGKIKKFINYTVDENDFKKYKWNWCGRYSIPFGLMTSYYLQNLYDIKLTGSHVGYATSIDRPHIPVDDLGMGTTAPANISHWVGYTAVGYK